QTVNTAIALNYRPDPGSIPAIYATIGEANETWENVLMRPAVEEVTKSVTADNTAAELVTKREMVKAEITELLIKRLAKENFIVTEVSITDFSFSPSFMAAIEAKQVAEQEAMRAENELTKHTTDVKKKEETAKAEAAATLTRAEAERQATVLKARGVAEAIQIEAAAEADYHEQTGKALTAETLRLREIQRWDGDTPDVVTSENLGIMLNRPAAKK
ncbi:MAG: prohibitin family protein, partial [Nannocystaceae bacterium]